MMAETAIEEEPAVEEAPIEEPTEEVVEEEPIEEVVEEVVEEEPAEEIVEEAQEEVAAEIIEEPAEEAVEEEPVAEEVQEEVQPEPVETITVIQPVPEVVEEVDPVKVEIIEQSKKEVAKKRREKVTATEVNNIITDDVAKSLVKKKRGAAPSKPKGPKSMVNIDTLNANFEKGELVNLTSLKAKKLIAKNAASIKVLARGTLTKPLTVEASAFSIEAVKMIVITGGTVIKG